MAVLCSRGFSECTRAVLVVVASLFSSAASAETFTLHARGSGEAPHAFYAVADWINENGETVSVSPTSGNAYVVDQERVINCNTTATFGGDSLQIGHVGGTFGRFMQTGWGAVATTGNLILERGYYTTWQGADDRTASMAGNTLVRSPASDPFWICPTHDAGSTGNFITHWKATISGAVGTGLYVGKYERGAMKAGNQKPTLVLGADNSSYFGVFEVVGTNTTLKIAYGESLGGPLGTYNPNALVLRLQACLMPKNASATLAASANRGIRVGEGGAVLKADAGQSMRIEWPFSGVGAVEKRGKGTLTLDSAWTQAGLDATESLNVNEGIVVFGANFSHGASNPIAVSKGGYVAAAPGATCTLEGVTFSGGGFHATYDEVLENSGLLVLPDGLPTDKVYPVLPSSTRGVKVAFLKVPVSAGTLTTNNFAVANYLQDEDLGVYNLPCGKISVDEADGYYVVSCTSHPLVTNVSNPLYLWKYGASAWSDGKLVHAGADYLLSAENAAARIESTELPEVHTFLGGVLSFIGGSSSQKALWRLTSTSFTADVRTGSFTEFEMNTSSANVEKCLHLCGSLHVGGTQGGDNDLKITAKKDGMSVVLDSRIAGSGTIAFRRYDSTINQATFVLAGDNAFEGAYSLYSGATTTNLRLRFSKNESFGANPKTLLTSGIFIQGACELYPIGSPTINHPNRRIAFVGSGTSVRVDEGETFTLYSPISFTSAKIMKYGRGVWSVGSAMTIENASPAPEICVSEGYLRAATAKACAGITVSVEEGAGIASEYRPGASDTASQYGMIVTDPAKFVVKGGRLALLAQASADDVHVGVVVAVLTVPKSMEQTIDGKTIVCPKSVPGYNNRVVKDDVTISGAEYVRYSVKFCKGMSIILR